MEKKTHIILVVFLHFFGGSLMLESIKDFQIIDCINQTYEIAIIQKHCVCKKI